MARERENNAECGTKCADPIAAHQRSLRIGRGGKGRRGLQKEGRVSRGYSFCSGATIPRGGETADGTEGERDERKVSTGFNVRPRG